MRGLTMNDSLHPDEIAANSVSTIVIAHRNARVIKWLETISIGEHDDLRRIYAGQFGCPTDEVVWWPEPMDNESLEWVYQKCHNQIDRIS